MEERTTDPEGLLITPADGASTGVLLLAGSSGRVDEDRARVLADAGATVWAIRWFGGAGQQPAPYEVPLELFTRALDRLAATCDRLVVIGTSFGAEAALLVAAGDDRVDACVAFAPSSVVWSGYDGERATSHWTRGDVPLPSVPFASGWEPDSDPPAYRDHYLRSLSASTPEAEIEVERIADLLLVAGGDDQVWPSLDFATAIVERRLRHGRPTTLVTHPEAGHRTLLPGEEPVTAGQRMARGGTPAADAELGSQAWPRLRQLL
jgi:uncharacterized protein